MWIEKIENKAEFRFDEIKDLLLKSIREYGCEAELRIFFANNPNEYMIIIYKDHCSFQRCGFNGTGSGERVFKTLEDLYKAEQIDDIVLECDWDKINDFNVIEDLPADYLEHIDKLQENIEKYIKTGDKDGKCSKF